MYQHTLMLESPVDVIVSCPDNGVVWCKGNNGLQYSIPHRCHQGRTLLKLPRPPKILKIIATKKFTIEVKPFNARRRHA